MIFARYKEIPFKAKAKTMLAGIMNISEEVFLIKSSFIAGSNKYAIEDVLAARISAKKTEVKVHCVQY